VAILPALFFTLAAFDVITLDTAFEIAEWTGVAVLGSYALFANLRAGLSVRSSIMVGLGFTALGAALVALKVLL
jgi:hypothetical protein